MYIISKMESSSSKTKSNQNQNAIYRGYDE